jgi:hypothetical protein
MKKYVLLLLVTASCLVSFAQKDNKDPYLTKSLSSDNVKQVNVQTSGGSISVTGGNAADARIEVYIVSSNGGKELSKEEIKKRLDESYQLDINVVSGKLTALAKTKEKNMDWKKGLSISFKVFVPKNVSSDVNTAGGSIHLSNLSGSQDFTTSGGSLHLDQLRGKINGSTSGGSIHVQNSSDQIDLITSGGSIEASNCEGKITLTTSGGSLHLNNLKGTIKAGTSGGSVKGKEITGELSASTSGGNIDFTDLSCSLKTSTSGGNIDVSFRELGKYVTIDNAGGNIDLTLPKGKSLDLKLTGNRIKTDNLSNFNGKVEDDEVNGKLNGGGIPVKVTAGNGKVSLAFR